MQLKPIEAVPSLPVLQAASSVAPSSARH